MKSMESLYTCLWSSSKGYNHSNNALHTMWMIVGIAVDGALMASKDFGFMLLMGLLSFAIQTKLLTHCASVPGIFLTFTLRLAMYASFSVGRAVLGYGNLGRAIRGGDEGLGKVESAVGTA